MLGKSNCHHLTESALNIALEVCMRLNLVVEYNSVCLCSIFVAVYRSMNGIIDLTDLNNLHAGLDWYSHSLLGYAVAVDNLKVTLYASASVAAHCRYYKWLCSPALKSIADSSDYKRIIRDAAATYCYGNRLALKCLSVNRCLFHLIYKMRLNILNLVIFIMLSDAVHLRHRYILYALYRKCYLRKINKSHVALLS